MSFKEFLKPTKKKIIIFLTMSVVSVYGFILYNLSQTHPFFTNFSVTYVTNFSGSATWFINAFRSFIFWFISPVLSSPLGYEAQYSWIIFILCIMLQLVYLYLVTCIVGKFWRKIYIKILVVIFILISIFMPFWPHLSTGWDGGEIQLAQVTAVCNSYCREIQNTTANSNKFNNAVWDYCYYTHTLYSSDYLSLFEKMGKENYFCRDGVHCFNLENGGCVFQGQVITPKFCLETMCKLLSNGGKNTNNAEEIISNHIYKGTCNLTEKDILISGKVQKEIAEKTWWEKYFENPDCSVMYNTS